MAAYTGGVKTVFIPKENIPDLEDVDETVKASIEFVPVSFVDEIISRALAKKPAKNEMPAVFGVSEQSAATISQ